MGLRAVNQLRENIRTLLFRRKEEQKALAFAASIDPSTLSKFLKGEREIQLANLDAVADFFGIATYQLFQPGISSLTERRSGSDRRSGAERRIGHTTRVMLSTAAEIEAHRPHRKASSHVVVAASSPRMDALAQAAAEYAKRIDAIISRFPDTGDETPTPRKKVAGTHPRDRVARGSDAEKD